MSGIVIHEVGMRDGLQMESQTVPTEQKIRWIETLIAVGVDIVQIGSFVHPVKVPQMADTDALFRHFTAPGRKPASVELSGLALNEKGLERSAACGVDLLCMGVSASDTHCRKNTGMGTEEATGRIIGMARSAVTAGLRVQVSVQSAFGCGFEGPVPEERVLGIIRRYLDAGLVNLSLADTAGHATPEAVERLFGAILEMDESVTCSCHLHNTYGLGLANCYAALRAGVTHFETAFAGLGGCPFTKVAGGNVCTEDFVYYLQRIGERTDIRLDTLLALARDAAEYFQRELPGMVYKAGVIKPPLPGTPPATFS